MLAFAGPETITIVLIVALVVFGGSKIPELARSLGKAKGEFQKGLSEEDEAKADAARRGCHRGGSCRAAGPGGTRPGGTGPGARERPPGVVTAGVDRVRGLALGLAGPLPQDSGEPDGAGTARRRAREACSPQYACASDVVFDTGVRPSFAGSDMSQKFTVSGWRCSRAPSGSSPAGSRSTRRSSAAVTIPGARAYGSRI